MIKTNVNIIGNKQFTTGSLACFLRLPLTRHNLAYASLLAQLQSNASLYLPSISDQQERLRQLYDLDLEITPQLFGRQLLLSYVANFVEPVALLDSDYTYVKIIETLALIIQHPIFTPRLFYLTQQQVLTMQQEALAAPANFALAHFFNFWYQKQPEFADTFVGPASEIKSATPISLKRYSDSLRMVPTTVVGLVKDNLQVQRLVDGEFKQAGLMKKFSTEKLVIPASLLKVKKLQKMNNRQAQLLLGYRYQHEIGFEGQMTGLVLVEYLAGDESSKLFVKIREKLGAAYAVEANNYPNNSLFLINAGLNPAQVTKAIDIIQAQIKQITEGKVDLDLLKKAKRSLLHLAIISSDREDWQIGHLLRLQLQPEYAHFDRQLAIKKVTATKLKNFVQNLELNESYVLA